jgi:hypothetical protein
VGILHVNLAFFSRTCFINRKTIDITNLINRQSLLRWNCAYKIGTHLFKHVVHHDVHYLKDIKFYNVFFKEHAPLGYSCDFDDCMIT